MLICGQLHTHGTVAAVNNWSAKPVERRATPGRSCKALTSAVYRSLYDLPLDGPARL